MKKKLGLVKRVKKIAKDLLVRKEELKQVKTLIKSLESSGASAGFGGALVTDKDGNTSYKTFNNKQEALDILKKVKKGDLRLGR